MVLSDAEILELFSIFDLPTVHAMPTSLSVCLIFYVISLIELWITNGPGIASCSNEE